MLLVWAALRKAGEAGEMVSGGFFPSPTTAASDVSGSLFAQALLPDK